MANKLSNIYLAFDTSNNLGTACLFNNKEIIFSEQIDEKFQHASRLSLIIKNAINIVDNKIDYLAIGTGPGSFIGIRVAMATAMGYSFGRNIPIVGFDSHLALLLSHDQVSKNNYVLTKAYGSVFYLSSFDDCKESKPKRSIGIEEFLDQSDKNFSLITDFIDERLIKAFNNIKTIKGPTPEGLRKAAIYSHKNNQALIANYLIEPNVTVKSKSAK